MHYFGYGLYLLKVNRCSLITNRALSGRSARADGARAEQERKPSRTSNIMDSGAATLACNNASGVGRAGTETLKVDGNVVSTQKALRP